MSDRANNARELERRHRADEDLSIDEYKRLLAFAERTIRVWQERAHVWRDRALTERAKAASARPGESDAAGAARMVLHVLKSRGLPRL